MLHGRRRRGSSDGVTAFGNNAGLLSLLITTLLAAQANDLAHWDVPVVHALPGMTRWIRGERFVGAISSDEENALKQGIFDALLSEGERMVTQETTRNKTYIWKADEVERYMEQRRADPNPGEWARFPFNETALAGHIYKPGHVYVLIVRMATYSRLRRKVAAPPPGAARRGVPADVPSALRGREKLAADRMVLWAYRFVALSIIGTVYAVGFDADPRSGPAARQTRARPGEGG